jgi:hypothetical protein
MRRQLSPFAAILIGGAIAGALDITYAIGFSALRGVAPIRILQSVASGLVGAPAFEGGVPVAALGLVLHFCIALLWAAIFYLASGAIPFLTRHPVVAGLFYGFLIYAVMNLVVVPLSAFPRKLSFPLMVLVTGILVHMFCIGLPISLAVRRTLPEKA